MTILVVEDAPVSRENFKDVLEDAGYDVVTVGNKKDALTWLKNNTPILVSLDIELPNHEGDKKINKEAGNQIFHEIDSNIPVIFVTDQSDERDEIMGFRMGAADYIPKPVNLTIYQCRIERLIRNQINIVPNNENPTIIGSLLVDRMKETVSWKGKILEKPQLTLREKDILCLLIEKPDKVRTYQELKLGSVQENSSVSKHVSNMIAKFKSIDSEFKQILNIAAKGYKYKTDE